MYVYTYPSPPPSAAARRCCVPGVEAVRGTGLQRHYIEVGGCCLRPVLVHNVRPIGRPPPPRHLENPLCIAVRSPRSGLRPRSNRGLRPRIDTRPGQKKKGTPPALFYHFFPAIYQLFPRPRRDSAKRGKSGKLRGKSGEIRGKSGKPRGKSG